MRTKIISISLLLLYSLGLFGQVQDVKCLGEVGLSNTVYPVSVESCDPNCVPMVYFIIGESEAAGRALQVNHSFTPNLNVYMWQDVTFTVNDQFEVLTYTNNNGSGNTSTTFFGPEIGFAEKSNSTCTECPTYIIKITRGGEKKCDYWLNGGNGELRINTAIPQALAELAIIAPNYQIGSLLMSQGINDAGEAQCTEDFYDNCVALISNIRAVTKPDLKIIMVNNHDSWEGAGNVDVQNATIQLAADDPFISLLDGNDYEVKSEAPGGDHHRNAQGNIDLGCDWYDIRN